MNVILANANRPSYGEATIPLPIPRKEYEHSLELLRQMEVGDAVKEDCWVIGIEGGPPILQQLKGMVVNIDEIDYLAKRLDSFDKRELAAFQGMADAHGLEKPKDLINLTFSCENVTVVQDFSDLERIGRQHYMNLNGGYASAYELEKINAKKVATDLLTSRGGKITPYGIVYENGAELMQYYDGRTFPEYLYEEKVLTLEISGGEQKSVWLDLPMPDSQIGRMLERGGFSEQDAEFVHVEIDLPNELTDLLCISNEPIRELNRMCAAIAELSGKDIDKLAAAALMAEPETALQITHLAENLDQFDFVPDARTPGDYGRHMIRESGHFEYDENLEEFYDYAKYGRQRIQEESGEFNKYGYIAYHGAMSLDELMMEDPAESYQQEQGLQMGVISC